MMKQARSMFAVATDNSSIFVVGGINNDKIEMDGCEIFDIK